MPPDDPSFNISGNIVENSESVIYLRYQITPDGTSKRDMDCRIHEAIYGCNTNPSVINLKSN